MSARTLLLITQDRDLRAEVACGAFDVEVARVNNIAGARRYFVEEALDGVADWTSIAYGPDVLAEMRRDERLSREVWTDQVALTAGRPPRLLRVSAALLGLRLLVLPEDWPVLLQRLDADRSPRRTA